MNKKTALLPVSIRKLGDFISKNNQIEKESNNCLKEMVQKWGARVYPASKSSKKMF